MHECPECGQACDCDGEDTWFDDLQTSLNCTHDCEEFDDDNDGSFSDFIDDFDDDSPDGHKLECTCEHCIQNHPEREIYLKDSEVAEHRVQATSATGS